MIKPTHRPDMDHVKFGRAAAAMAARNSLVSEDDALEMLAMAMWAGEFNPPIVRDTVAASFAEIFLTEKWLMAPIESPAACLTAEQRGLQTRPMEYYTVAARSILMVMYCAKSLPGAPTQWDKLLDTHIGPQHSEMETQALEVLSGVPLAAYSEAGRRYLEGIYILKDKLQGWLDVHSDQYAGLFEFKAPAASNAPPPAHAGNRARRGRPSHSSWTAVDVSYRKLKLSHPDAPNKVLAHLVREAVLACFEEDDVPAEDTIRKHLSDLRTPPDDDSSLH